MAERKAVNKYYPPEWTPSKGSINKFRGTHALRERARKLHMGILIIRFEMPFNIWCNGCENHIGMGVRYNAEKTKVGMYYTTPVYKFRMKCHLCTNHFEIQTDPQNLDYVILDGARRQERRWDPTENEQVVPEEKETQMKMALDAMYCMEHKLEDKLKQKTLMPSLSQLEEYKERWKDDYELNKILRQKFREEKKVLTSEAEKDMALLKKTSLGISLLPESSEDRKLAGLLKLTSLNSYEERLKLRREEILSRPLFSSTVSTENLFTQLIKEKKIKTLLKPNTKAELGVLSKPSTVSSKNMRYDLTPRFQETQKDTSYSICSNTESDIKDDEITESNVKSLNSAHNSNVSDETTSTKSLNSLVLVDYDSSDSNDSSV